MLLTTSVTAPAPSDAIATILYILVALMALVGVGGFTGWLKGRNTAAVKEDKLDRVIDMILDPETGFDSHSRQLAEGARQLADIAAKVSRNGGGSQSVGDIASRVEKALGEARGDIRGIRSKLDQHVGAHDERDTAIAARVTVLERKVDG